MAVERALERNDASLAAGRLRIVARRMWVGLSIAAPALLLPLFLVAGSLLARARQAQSAPASQSSQAGQPDRNSQPQKPNTSAQAGRSSGQSSANGQSSGQADKPSSQSSGKSAGQASGQAQANSQSNQAGPADAADPDDNPSDDPYLRDYDAAGDQKPPAARTGASGEGTTRGGTADITPGEMEREVNSAISGESAQPGSAAGDADSAADEKAAPAPGSAAPLAAAPAVPAKPLSPEELRRQQFAAEFTDLLRMATDLKAAVDKTSKDELSISVIRKAGEIEQYARKLRVEPGTNADKTGLTAGKD